MNSVTNLGRIQRFIILEFLQRAMKPIEAQVGWVSSGEIVHDARVQEGCKNILATSQRFRTGENFGKRLLNL